MNINTVQEWFESNITRAKYQMYHGEDWWWKMNEVHDKILEKLDESCCENIKLLKMLQDRNLMKDLNKLHKKVVDIFLVVKECISINV